jgi:plasmid stabilization system protein ParE
VSALPIFIEPEAEADLLEAYDWYEKQRPGLGREFIDCVDDVFEQISERPTMYATAFRNVRQALVLRFPYVVCFTLGSAEISVIAVHHCKRHPRTWQSRIK